MARSKTPVRGNGRCAVCKQIPTGRGFCVDHDHRTGRTRGLLCTSCNTALGNVKDSPRTLAAMIVYLEDHGITWINEMLRRREWEE